MKKENKKQKLLVSNIAQKLSGMLVIVFVVLIIATSLSASYVIKNTTNHALESIAKANGCQVQEFMNLCRSTGLGLTSQIESLFLAETLNTDVLLELDEDSEAYEGLKLNKYEKELESFLIATAKSTVANNDSVIGIGIMFEPNAFTNEKRDYALYFSEEGNGEIGYAHVGPYDEFSLNDYYQIVVGKKATLFTEPYYYNNMWMITGATPMYVGEKQVGVINIDITMDEFYKLDLTSTQFPSLNTQIVSDQGKIVFDIKDEDHINQVTKDVVFKNEKDIQKIVQYAQQGKPFHVSYQHKDGYKVTSYSYPLTAGDETWQTIATVRTSDINKQVFYTISILFVLCLLAYIIIIVSMRSILKGKLKPIHFVVDAAKEIARGNLDINLNVTTNDEIGELAGEFSKTSEFLGNIITDLSETLRKIANNDFTVETHVDYRGDFEGIKQSILDINRNLQITMEQVTQGANQVSEGADQLSYASQELASATSSENTSVKELSDSIKNMSIQVESNTGYAVEASGLAKVVGEEVQSSNDKMSEMVNAMEEITKTSHDIELIIQNIESIASQTNLLSLNAAIEAARAGEAGRGFAIVADQIRDLAAKSAESAKDTRELIGSSLNAVDQGTKVADDTEQMMQGLAEKILAIVEKIEIIAEASKKQKSAIEKIEHNVADITITMENNSGTSEEYAATSEELSAQAESLKELVGKFKI